MLTIQDFNLFTDTEKAGAVWQGTFLGDRPGGGRIMQLYSLGSFYVEVLTRREPTGSAISAPLQIPNCWHLTWRSTDLTPDERAFPVRSYLSK